MSTQFYQRVVLPTTLFNLSPQINTYIGSHEQVSTESIKIPPLPAHPHSQCVACELEEKQAALFHH